MSGFKSRFSSSTIRACLLGIAVILGGLGYNFYTEEDATKLADAIASGTQPSEVAKVADKDFYIELVKSGVALFCFLAAWRGREKATTKIDNKTNNPDNSGPTISRNSLALIAPLLLVPFIGGCTYPTRVEHATFREGLWQGLSTTGKEHNQWAGFFAGDANGDGTVDGPPRLDLLPDLSLLTQEQRTIWLQARLYPMSEARKLMEEDRRRAPATVTVPN